MISPRESLEKRYGKQKDAKDSMEWLSRYNIYLDGWMDGFEYQSELRKEVNDLEAISDLQRGII